jgi:hypothetical protein
MVSIGTSDRNSFRCNFVFIFSVNGNSLDKIAIT